MNMWEEGASIALTQSSLGQPLLAKLTINDFKHRKCFRTIIHVYSWSRVIPIFEHDAYFIFILDTNYASRASSILMFQRLEPDITDTARLKKANSTGFAGDSFVRTYFEEVLGFEKKNIDNGSSKYKYEGRFTSIKGGVAYVELPDEKLFFSEQHCKLHIAAAPTYFSRGFSFAFKKSSPIATDVSRDIRNLYAYETLQSLVYSSTSSVRVWAPIAGEILYYKPAPFPYFIFGAISTLCLLLFLVDLVRNYCCDQDETEENLPPC
ncbi:hypothetical protein PTKIN_Ptkin18bG0115800 [Pterospermum kingtungense]